MALSFEPGDPDLSVPDNLQLELGLEFFDACLKILDYCRRNPGASFQREKLFSLVESAQAIYDEALDSGDDPDVDLFEDVPVDPISFM